MNNREERFDISPLMTPPTREQAAEYIHEMLTELIPIAKSVNLPPVMAHLLEMARLEAESLFKRRRASRPV
jgi:hypothetical protein